MPKYQTIIEVVFWLLMAVALVASFHIKKHSEPASGPGAQGFDHISPVRPVSVNTGREATAKKRLGC